MKKVIPVVDENDHRVLSINEKTKIGDDEISALENLEDIPEEELNVDELNLESFDEQSENDKNDENLSDEEVAYSKIKNEELMEEKEFGFSDDLEMDDINLPSMTLKMAKDEAELLIRDAKNRAFDMEKEAHERGYEEGLKLAEEKYKLDLDEQKASLREKEAQLQNTFDEKLRSYEPKIASIIAKLVTQLVGTSNDEDIILFLVRLALAENTSKGKVVINVCEDDFEKVRTHFEDTEHREDKLVIEIKKNETLLKNDCLLETEFGVVDSSLSVRLDSFLKEISIIKESLKRVENV